MARRSTAYRETEEAANEARRLLFYHAETGLLIRRRYWMGMNAGEEAGYVWSNGMGIMYRIVRLNGLEMKGHRIAWLLHHGNWPSLFIDHADGNGLNNKIDNLREATVQQNGMNRRFNKKNTSGVTGVVWRSRERKWIAQIRFCGSHVYLGSFDNFEDAVSARKEAEIKYGFSERHGANKTDLEPSTKGDRIP